jgi:hypothetical protein
MRPPSNRTVQFQLLQDLLPDIATQIHEAIPEYFDDYVEDPNRAASGGKKERRGSTRGADAKPPAEPAELVRAWVASLGFVLYLLFHEKEAESEAKDGDDEDSESKEEDEGSGRACVRVVLLSKETMTSMGQETVRLSFKVDKAQPVVHMTSDHHRLCFVYVSPEGQSYMDLGYPGMA